MSATRGVEQCARMVDELEAFLQRAKLMPSIGRQVFAARDQAIAHRKAGRNAACIASITEAYRILGRPVDPRKQ